MKKYLPTLASLLGFLSACLAPTQNPIPTPYPPEYLPTVIALTASAANLSGTETAIALKPTLSPTETVEPTVTFTPPVTWTPTSIPGHKIGVIQFSSPGPMSKVISPIQLLLRVIASENQKVQFDLYGEDGRLLTRELRKVPSTSRGAILLVEIPFEIRAAAELGRITVSKLDDAGRLEALNSVRILLLSSGVNEINPAGHISEPVRVVQPLEDEAVSGGVLNVNGDIWPVNLQPLILELVSPSGKSLGLRILTIDSLDAQLFKTTIPYKVTEPTLARLTIRQSDDRMPGLFYVYSQLVSLNP